MSWFATDTRLIEAEERIAAAAEKLVSRASLIGAGLSDIAEAVKTVRYCLNRPGLPKVAFLSEDRRTDVKKILFKVAFAPEADPTTVQRELSVQVGDTLPDVRTVGVDEPELDGYSAPVDTPVHIEQTDIDDVGNRSTPAVLDVTVQDVFPPAQPGLPSVAATGEVNVEE